MPNVKTLNPDVFTGDAKPANQLDDVFGSFSKRQQRVGVLDEDVFAVEHDNLARSPMISRLALRSLRDCRAATTTSVSSTTRGSSISLFARNSLECG